MKFEKTPIEGAWLCLPTIHGDDRGHFFESFNAQTFAQININTHFVQDNRSLSKRGTLRGFHFQKGELAQAKLVQVLKGEVLDVILDIRPNSKSFKNIFSVVLDEKNKHQLYVPRGCAHAFVVLSEQAEFFYKCDNFYHPASEGGIIFNDPELDVDWRIPADQLILSAKDAQLPTLQEYLNE